MDKVNKHPTIPDHILQDIAKVFSAIENVLNLHYASHTTDPTLENALQSASNLLNRKVNIKNFQVILGIQKDLYRLYQYDSNNNDPSSTYIALPIDTPVSGFSRALFQRKKAFFESLNDWIDTNGASKGVNTLLWTSVAEIVPRKKVLLAGCKVSKPISPTKRSKLLSDLKNDNSKFRFQERNEEMERLKGNGLSLLERIKLKEKLKKESIEETPEEKYEHYLNGKAVQIYNIIYQMCQQDLKSASAKTYSIINVIKIIQDSLDYPISDTEVHDSLRFMSKKFENRNFIILKVNGISVLRILKLDRKNDLSVLN